MTQSDAEAISTWTDGVSGWGSAMRGMASYLLQVGGRTLTDWGGVVSPNQGGFGYSIDPIDGDPDQALADIGGAKASHRHGLTWWGTTVLDNIALGLDHVGFAILFNPSVPITVTLPHQDTVAWSPGESVTLLNYSAQTVTVAPAAGVNVDGVSATNFNLVQHAFLNLVRMPANNFWNRSGAVA